MDGCVEEWVDGWIDGWMGRCMDEPNRSMD